MTERKLSALQREYRQFFLAKLDLYGVQSPAHLSKDNKSLFFTSVKEDWARIKADKTKQAVLTVAEAEEESPKFNDVDQEKPKTKYPEKIEEGQSRSTPFDRVTNGHDSRTNKSSANKEVIRSKPNVNQTNDLRIQFTPNDLFHQADPYDYPVVKMPDHLSLLKLPRAGRSNQKGYKENEFYSFLLKNIKSVNVANDLHMVIPNFNRPYEPDIVLYDERINLYLDIEIDEPYDGYYRYPTHALNPEDCSKQDNVRDLFFTESGWIVIRFTEKQIHTQMIDCCLFVQSVVDSVQNLPVTVTKLLDQEPQWDYNQSIQWQKINYREKYLGIERFNKQYSRKEIEVDPLETEGIEAVIQRTKLFSFEDWSSNIAFDEESHKYIHPKDQTGNAEYISATTLIERFFPFDLKRYIERKAIEEQRSEEDVLDEYLLIRDEAAEKGTFLHQQIEKFLKGVDYDPNIKEFELFLRFYDNEIKKRHLVFSDAEKRIYSQKYNVAGTVDCLFKKQNTDEYVMVDWKRSKKLVIDGQPRKFGHGYALSELRHLDNSSYFRYCLQQNLYKYILEREYSIKISSMKLVVLHDIYSSYYVVNVPEMNNDTLTILNSIKLKI